MNFAFQALAWLMFTTVVFLYVAPVQSRAMSAVSVNAGRSVSFALMAMLFVFAYPDERRIVGIFCIVGAIAAELLEFYFPEGNSRVDGALIKCLSVTLGLLAGALLLKISGLH
uniref:Putative membrane protein n=1 Tax=Rhizobium rhizogenes TaxID=359 RepID=A0A7S5DRN5_RHIRH|nr:VanZ family protein [Rhizobium rhizogenes]QCL10031.1 putative membrane protein [Rhizobium rhizogenes]